MQGLFVQFVCTSALAACCIAPFASESHPTPRFERAIDAYAQLPAAKQESWLADLFARRAMPACREFMTRAALAAVHTRHTAVLKRIRAGKQLRDDGLVTLLAEVDEQERAAIVALTRRFRLINQYAFAANASEAAARLAAWHAIESEWDEAARPWEQQPKLIAWLRAALTQPPLPQPPSFAPPKPLASANKPTAARTSAISSQINAAELSARIAGYNLALNGLVGRLHGQKTWQAGQLTDVADSLAELTRLRADLNLYWELLSESEKAHLEPPASTEIVIALVAAKTAVVRKHLQQAADAGGGPEANSQLRTLDRISRQLSELAASQR